MKALHNRVALRGRGSGCQIAYQKSMTLGQKGGLIYGASVMSAANLIRPVAPRSTPRMSGPRQPP
jgi:hypothetical protein